VQAILQPHEGDSPIADYADEPGRLGRAFCDREAACGRIGRAWESDRACVEAMSARAGAEIRCRVDPDALATCLTAIRAAPCPQALDRLGALSVCGMPEICAVR
jgi:hypothetical protein